MRQTRWRSERDFELSVPLAEIELSRLFRLTALAPLLRHINSLRELDCLSSGRVLTVMDFGRSFPLDPLPSGWRHRTFWTRSPMTMSFAVKDGVPSMRFETHDSASMLFRSVDIELAAYPMLACCWYIELPIRSSTDERTREGDDHPARLFLRFLTGRGEKRAMEVIWGNRLKPGDYKYIGGFPHFVADAGEDRIGRWLDEKIDLARVYAEIWKD